MVCGALAWTDPRDESTIFPHVVGNFIRVEDNRDIKVSKENNTDRVKKRVQRLAPAQPTNQVSEVAVVAQPVSNGLRQSQN